MKCERTLVVDDQMFELLTMLAANRRQSVEQTVTELVEAEFERIEPGLIDDLRSPGAALKRLYAAVGRPAPVAFRETVGPGFSREHGDGSYDVAHIYGRNPDNADLAQPEHGRGW